MRTIGTILFPGFELLDVFGPLEMYGIHKDEFDIKMVAESGQPVPSGMGPASVVDHVFTDGHIYDVLLVPGGPGTRAQVDNPVIVNWLRDAAPTAELVTTVCTGTSLLARTGLLDGKRATTNKNAFAWVASCGPDVLWQKQARWIEDGRYFTSSGVTAGMDMTLSAITHLLDHKKALEAANYAEYDWHQDASWDPFAAKAGLV